MATADYGALAAKAKESGLGSGKVLEGDFRIRVKDTNAKLVSNNTKDQLGFMCEVEGGPDNGHTFWLNQTISPESEKAMQFFWRFCSWFGVTPDDVADAFSKRGNAEDVAALFDGREADVTLQREERDGWPAKEKLIKGKAVEGNAVGSTPPASPPAAASSLSEDGDPPSYTGDPGPYDYGEEPF